jgi:cytidylate kinase
MIITISGRQGAGKTTVAKTLAKKLGYKFVSVGDLQGEIAIKKGMTITELMTLGKKEKWVHLEMDKKIEEIGKRKDNFIIEGWIAYHFIPHSFKIFLDVDENVGAKRIFRDFRKDEPSCKSVEETKERLRERLKETREGFKKTYDIDFLDKSQYDLILDTTNLDINKVVKKILEKIKKWCKKEQKKIKR